MLVVDFRLLPLMPCLIDACLLVTTAVPDGWTVGRVTQVFPPCWAGLDRMIRGQWPLVLVVSMLAVQRVLPFTFLPLSSSPSSVTRTAHRGKRVYTI